MGDARVDDRLAGRINSKNRTTSDSGMNLVYSNNVTELFLSFMLNFSAQLYDEEEVVQG